MVVGVLRLALHIPFAHSLKEKRGVVKSILGRCRVRFPVSAAEVDDQELLQSSVIAFTVVFAEANPVHHLFERIEEEVERQGVEIVGIDRELIPY